MKAEYSLDVENGRKHTMEAPYIGALLNGYTIILVGCDCRADFVEKFFREVVLNVTSYKILTETENNS